MAVELEELALFVKIEHLRALLCAPSLRKVGATMA